MRERTGEVWRGAGREERHEVAKRNWEARCGTRRGMPRGLFLSLVFSQCLPRPSLFFSLALSRRWPCRDADRACGPSARHGAAPLRSARCATPWCCRLTYLSAVTPPATGSAASVQSGVLPICIPDSPPGQSNDSPVYPYSRSVALLSLPFPLFLLIPLFHTLLPSSFSPFPSLRSPRSSRPATARTLSV